MTSEDTLRLPMELVPRSCWYSNLRSELPKRDWDRLRREQYALADFRCEVCGEEGSAHPVECHERWSYETSEAGVRTQKLLGLIALCPACHEVKHMGFAESRGRLDKALAQFARVNDLTERQALDRAHEEFATWAHRSRRDWALDLSWLEERGVKVGKIIAARERKQTAATRDKQRLAAILMAQAEHAMGPTPEDRVRVVTEWLCGCTGVFDLPDPESGQHHVSLFHRAVVMITTRVCPGCARSQEGLPWGRHPEGLGIAPLGRPEGPQEALLAPGGIPTPSSSPQGPSGASQEAAEGSLLPGSGPSASGSQGGPESVREDPGWVTDREGRRYRRGAPRVDDE